SFKPRKGLHRHVVAAVGRGMACREGKLALVSHARCRRLQQADAAPVVLRGRYLGMQPAAYRQVEQAQGGQGAAAEVVAAHGVTSPSWGRGRVARKAVIAPSSSGANFSVARARSGT